MTFLNLLQQSWLARLVQETVWGYPVVLTCHAVGMAMLAGVVLMICFRVLGFAPAIPVVLLRPMLKLALGGFLINVISGAMLFMADAAKFFASNPFRIKMVLLIAGGLLLGSLTRRVLGDSVAQRGASALRADKMIAAAAVLVWVGVIVAGRLIAYVDVV